MATLDDRTRIAPAIDRTVFPSAPADKHWSSTPIIGMPAQAWHVEFGVGEVFRTTRETTLAVRLVRRTRPDVVISAGAGVAVPFFVMARLLRIPTVYVEVIDRIDSRTLTGRLCRPLSTRFLVQWPEQARLNRVARHRQARQTRPAPGPDDVG